jgi:spermidine synthase
LAARPSLHRIETLDLAVFLSGISALVFETLWFRLCGLMLGNGVWASSLVLGAFMAGLAIGNLLSGFAIRRLRRPLVAYAGLEAAIGGLGLGLVLLLPRLTPLLAPAFGAMADDRGALAVARIVVAFLLMLAPAAAMGATLPTLVAAQPGGRFGTVLGRLYGWNTLGAVVGAVAGEMVAVELWGIRGSALAACVLNVVAALLALRLARTDAVAGTAEEEGKPAWSPLAARLVGAACVCGAALLALEVVWFRLLSLVVITTATSFGVMLAVVLLGISLGGLLGGAWTARHAHAATWAPPVALAAGILVVWGFATFHDPSVSRYVGEVPLIAGLAVRLMLPASIASGVLFVLVGSALQAELGARTWAAAVLTAANTLGAVAGASVAGFLLLPRLGLERSMLALAALYVVAAGATVSRAASPRALVASAAGALALAGAVFAFPHGLAERIITAQVPPAARAGSRIVAVREGLLNTLVYLRREAWGRPWAFSLVTNGFSMTDTTVRSRRYMNAYIYWPMALRPDSRSALLVCYGVGNTAASLVAQPGLQSIDVVDISPEVVEMADVVERPTGSPLRDPRVTVHVEDGRFFLLTTRRQFDLITAEPPPPAMAGVVNLYTREYFQLVRDRLTEGGVATHWLPVHLLQPRESRAIVAAFCSVFSDCSMWAGHTFDWMLVGTRGLASAPSADRFASQWAHPAARQELLAVGFERPELLGAAFLADAAGLEAFVAGEPPLRDDHPRLVGDHRGVLDPFYLPMLDTQRTAAAFAASPWVKRMWPLQTSSLPYFTAQDVRTRYDLGALGARERRDALVAVLDGTTLRELPLLLMGTDMDEVGHAEAVAAEGGTAADVPYVQGLGALAARDYARAADLFDEAARRGAAVSNLTEARAFARALSGNVAAAVALARQEAAPPELVEWLSGVQRP